jgi:hypothetical protein
MMLPNEPVSSMLHSRDPGPNKWLCPTNSSRDDGRSRSANGAADCRFDGPVFARLAETFWVKDKLSVLRFLEELEKSVPELPGVLEGVRFDASEGGLEVRLKIGARLLWGSCFR